MKITILIPTRFNSRYIVELCLQTIRKYTTIPYDILIGDSGVDEETREYLNAQPDIRVVNCPDPLRPKDYLVRKVKTPFFLILHDDTQILKEGWLSRRLKIIKKRANIGIVGKIEFNYEYRPVWKRSITNSCVHKRFFPNVMMVRKEVQDELDLHWGKIGKRGIIGGFDTGAIAYLQFLRQNKWKFKRFETYHDVKHWGCKTWAVRKKILGDEYKYDIDKVISVRDQKIALIRKLLESKQF